MSRRQRVAALRERVGAHRGAAARRASGEAPARLRRKLLELDAEPLRAAVVKGLLETFSAELVNLVNALAIARSRGLVIEERRDTEAQRYAALLTVRVGSTEVAGTLTQGEPRVVLIDGFWVDVPVEGHLLLTKHQDKPGLVWTSLILLGEQD